MVFQYKIYFTLNSNFIKSHERNLFENIGEIFEKEFGALLHHFKPNCQRPRFHISTPIIFQENEDENLIQKDYEQFFIESLEMFFKLDNMNTLKLIHHGIDTFYLFYYISRKA